MKSRKVLSLFLALVLVISLAPAVFAAEETIYAKRGDIVEFLLTAADDYNPEVKRDDIIKGDDGGLREDDFITRAEAFVMISRAFGSLEAPTGHNARITVTQLECDDIPEWAAADVENLVQGGVLVGTGSGKLSPDEYVTTEQIQLVVGRIFLLKASNLKDNFYAFINKDVLDSLAAEQGSASSGTFESLNAVVTDQLSEIISDVAGKNNTAGSPEQKIADFYKSVVDIKAREAAGNEPIQKYLDAAAKIETLDDAVALRETLLKETGVSLLVDFDLTINPKNSSQYVMYFSPAFSPSLPKQYYGKGYEAIVGLYKSYVAQILELSGLDTETSAEYAEYVVELETLLAANMLDTQDYTNISLTYNQYTLEELQKMMPSINLEGVLKSYGFVKESSYIVEDEGLLAAYASAIESADSARLRAYMQFSVVSSFASCLSESYNNASGALEEALYGVSSSYTTEEIGVLYTQALMDDYLGKLYIDRHFSQKAKTDVEGMVDDIIEIYEKRINALDWMSDTTKKMALKKLETMTVKIGYPDSWESVYDSVDIKSPSNGGSFFSNVAAMNVANQKAVVAIQGTAVDKSTWYMSAYTVNAYYNPTANEIVFPAAILQAPFYDEQASRSQNLGGIGFVIAHEITHSFDNSGAQYDEKGSISNWWTDEDYAKFSNLCYQVALYYNGIEVAPGIVNNGMLTLGENIADLGAIACVVEAVRASRTPDFETMFKNLALCWAQTSGREYMSLLTQIDVHSANSVRVNRTLQSVEEFYATFDIKPGDGMYVSPEARVSIW